MRGRSAAGRALDGAAAGELRDDDHPLLALGVLLQGELGAAGAPGPPLAVRAVEVHGGGGAVDHAVLLFMMMIVCGNVTLIELQVHSAVLAPPPTPPPPPLLLYLSFSTTTPPPPPQHGIPNFVLLIQPRTGD